VNSTVLHFRYVRFASKCQTGEVLISKVVDKVLIWYLMTTTKINKWQNSNGLYYRNAILLEVYLMWMYNT